MTYTDEQLEKAASGKAIDEALDAVLKAAGSGLRHYTMPGTLYAMRSAMRDALSKAYIDGSNDNYKAMRKAVEKCPTN